MKNLLNVCYKTDDNNIINATNTPNRTENTKENETIDSQQKNRQESRTRINNEQTNKQIVTTKKRQNQSGHDKVMIISGQNDRVEEFNLEHRTHMIL